MAKRLLYLRASDVQRGDHLLVSGEAITVESCCTDDDSTAFSWIDNQGHIHIWSGDSDDLVEVAETAVLA